VEKNTLPESRFEKKENKIYIFFGKNASNKYLKLALIVFVLFNVGSIAVISSAVRRQQVVTSNASTSGTISMMPIDDVFVSEDDRDKNFNNQQYLRVDDNPVKLTYLKFNLSNLSSIRSTDVQNAIVRLKIYDDKYNGTLIAKRVTTNNWSENVMTFRNRPTGFDNSYDSLENNGWLEFNVTSLVRDNLGKVFSVVIKNTDSGNNIFYSKESTNNEPVLKVEYNSVNILTPTAKPTVTTSPTPTLSLGTTTPTPKLSVTTTPTAKPTVTTSPSPIPTITPEVTQIPGKQVLVSNNSELSSAISTASPGDVITAIAGTYTGTYNVSRSGNASSPIIIRSQIQSGALLNSAHITITGNYVQISNFEITGDGILVLGNHNRVSRNLFHNTTGNPAVDINGSASYNRVDYNEITNWIGFGVRITNATTSLTGNRIDHNYIHHNLSIAGAEAINLGGGRDSSLLNFGTLVEYNLLDHISTDEESELISIKSSGNTIQYNTFRDSEDLYVNIRHGQNDKFLSNYLINENMQTQGDNHQVIGNYISGGFLRLRSGDCIEPQVPTGGGCHPAARYNFVAANTVQGGKLFVGDSGSIPATDNHLAGNNASIDTSGYQKGTIIDLTYNGEPGKPILLTPQMVGIYASGN
jgi:hypothetical protein